MDFPIKKERVRYGKNTKGCSKNTLITTEHNGIVYFGISRCNNHMGDHFNKDRGKLIAARRMELAIQEENKSHEYIIKPEISLIVHESGLRGSITRENVKKLIEYFKNIDEEKPGHSLTISRWLHS